MRLINVTTFAVEEFIGENIPPYVILSHTWGSEEVTLQDMTAEGGHYKSKHGFIKIEHCCSQALQDGFKWAWVDTCCINKASSAELSEAINSMFTWYANSRICYVYLEDSHGDFMLGFQKPCRWFGRAWTLQELLAPDTVIFYDQNWKILGSAANRAVELAWITRIPSELFLHEVKISSFSVAVRMSWAAQRQATRIEDRAYSLLGLFDINMPLLYGEGEKAFARLQRKIIKSSRDLSIFAWSRPNHAGQNRAKVGWLLAHSLDDFENVPEITSAWAHIGEVPTETVSPTRITSNSLHIQLPLVFNTGVTATALAWVGRTTTSPQEDVYLVLYQENESYWYRDQQRLVMLGPSMIRKERYKPTTLNFSTKHGYMILDDSMNFVCRETPDLVKMPTIRLAFDAHGLMEHKRCRIRYIVDANNGPAFQTIRRETAPNVKYSVVSTDGDWRDGSPMALAQLSFSLSHLQDVETLLQPEQSEMRTFAGKTSTLMVLDMMHGDEVELAVVIGMQITERGAALYLRSAPDDIKNDIDDLWQLPPPPRKSAAFDSLTSVTSRNLHRWYNMSATIRPRGCDVHQTCECRPSLVSVCVNSIVMAQGEAPYWPSKPWISTGSGKQTSKKQQATQAERELQLTPLHLMSQQHRAAGLEDLWH